MVHDQLKSVLEPEADFNWRGHESTRLEVFSDAVFAFAVTLLVVSLEVPRTFQQLLASMRGFLAFGACFAILINLWYHHYRFFRRYALQTGRAIFLNSLLLFFLLFYVYPLKFVAVLVFSGGAIDAHDARLLFLIYGAGYFAVSLLMGLLYQHAWTLREALELTAVERLVTRKGIVNNFAMTVISLVSAVLAFLLPARWVGIAGYFYFSIPIYFTLAGFYFERQLRSIKAPHAMLPTEL
jgi:uncharacterized membrane protein